MNLIAAMLLIVYATVLGAAVRLLYHSWRNTQLTINHLTEFLAHSFFQGLVYHTLILSAFRWLPLKPPIILGILIGIFCGALLLTLKKLRLTRLPSHSFNLWLAVACLLASGALYWMAQPMPNLAWDSWAVWELRAWQWIHHGFDASFLDVHSWSTTPGALYNNAAHYPEAISLWYFTLMLITKPGHHAMQIVLLYAYAMLCLLMLVRLHTMGSKRRWLALMWLILYTIPFLNSHLILAGYADLWVAIFITLIMLTLYDYQDRQLPVLGLTLLCYGIMLPMLKLEGWIWLGLFLLSHSIVMQLGYRGRLVCLLLFLGMPLLLWLSGGINWDTPMGPLILQSNQVTLFNLWQTELQWTDVSHAFLQGFILQNNWSLLWFGLPFLLFFIIRKQHNKPTQVSHLFFVLSLLAFCLLFMFTKASQWAQDMTAMNRIVLQLIPAYTYLLFNMLNQWRTSQDGSNDH